MSIGLGIGLSASFGGNNNAWFKGSQFRAIDIADSQSKGPAAILDFRKGQQALTTVASGSIAAATTAQLIAINADTYANALTFTRASTATYIDVNGVMQTAAVNETRFDYTNGSRQQLVEGASTNLLTSSSFQSLPGDWSAGSPTGYAGNAGVAPDGTNTAMSWAGSGRFFQQANTANGPYTASIWIKTASGSPSVTIVVKDAGSDTVRGTSTVSSTSTWQRISASGVTTGGPGARYEFSVSGGTALLWGAQLEALPFATSYIPTAGSAVTRAGDLPRLGPKLEALIQRAGGGTIVWKGRLEGLPPATIGMRFLGGSSGSSFPGVIPNGAVEAWNGTQNITTMIIPVTSPFGTATIWSTNYRGLSANGSTLISGTGVLATDLSKVWLGSEGTNGGANPLYGWIDQLIIYPFRATDAEVQRLAAAYA